MSRRYLAILVQLRRTFNLAAGGLLLLAGLITLPLPLPVGLPLMVVALCLLTASSRSLRQGIARLRRRHPSLSHRLDALKPRLPLPLRRLIERTDPAR